MRLPVGLSFGVTVYHTNFCIFIFFGDCLSSKHMFVKYDFPKSDIS